MSPVDRTARNRKVSRQRASDAHQAPFISQSDANVVQTASVAGFSDDFDGDGGSDMSPLYLF